MSVIQAPEWDPEDTWPTLGPEVCDFLEERAVFGPGDKRGEPYVVDAEVRALVYRMYEVYPRGHENAGKRRFKRCAISLRKGSRKTEIGGLIAYAELHPEGPVRCDGFRKVGKAWVPVGRPVKDPYIPMMAYTEEQTEDLAYAVLYSVCSEGPDNRLFDVGLERVMRVDGYGRAAAMAGAPDARDGARTTFQHFDETHRLFLIRLVKAHATMLANIPKRPLADPWSLETSVVGEPGDGSVAEKTWEYAQAIREGRAKDSRLFFFHRQASEPLEEVLGDDKALKLWIEEASGPAVSQWTDYGSVVDLLRDPTSDRAYVERTWGNRRVQASDRAFDLDAWKARVVSHEPVVGCAIVLGFDGSQVDDATGLVATEIECGYQWVVGAWEQPFGNDDWEVPVEEVDEAIEECFDLYSVSRFYADPPYWRDEIRRWAGQYGSKVVIEWWTNRKKTMAYALRGYDQAMRGDSSDLKHDGNEIMARHIGNAHRRFLNMRDEETGERLFVIGKERSDSPNKIDLAMAGCLSWEARGDAVAAGANRRRGRTYSFA